ncbi:MAG: hypothetical protein WBE76_18805 [Terracidiphilus sp.]
MVDKSRQIEDEVVKSIRDFASVNPLVGSNCMSVLIAPPHREALVRVRFFAEKVQLARNLGMESAPEEYEASFSPWIIGPSSTMAPQIVVGDGWSFELGPFRVELDGKPAAPVFDGKSRKVRVGFSNHVRPPRPI